MSEKQEDKRRLQEEQALALRQQQWAGVDPAVIEQWAAAGVPAGFQFGESAATNEAQNWKPGRIMTPEEVQKVVSNVEQYTQGSKGMTLDSYLADPRAAIKVENGQYVYRPESLKPEDDWQGIPKTGFWDGAGPFALVLAGMALPYAASLGALGAGASASGTAGGTAGGAGGTAAGGAAAGEFALVPAGSGAGVGGVGTGGLGLGTAGSSIGLTPGLTTAGGTALSGGAIGATANTLAGAAGVGSLSSIPTTAQLASMLGTTPSLAQQVMDVVKSLAPKPGTTSQTLTAAIKGATGLDVSPETVGGLAKIGIAAAALTGGSGSNSDLNGTAGSQTAAANDAMGLAREQWEWNKARADELLPQQKELIQQQIDIGKTSAERAKSEWDTYQSLYLPAERQYVEKMTTWDSPDRRTQRIQEAVADVNRGYDAASGTLERNLARSGVRAGGDGYVQAMGDLTRARAADTAGSTNNARRQVENEGVAGLERVTNIGRGRPSTSFAADQLALSAGNSANANTNQNTATTNAGLTSSQGWFNSGVSALNSAANVQNAATKNAMSEKDGMGALLGKLFLGGFADGGLVRRGARPKQPMGYADGGLIRKAERKLQKHLGPMMRGRGYAEGGLVRGPGTETSDSIPAVIDGQEPTALSTGEAVLNAEAVQIVGPEFVERINQVGLERRRPSGQVIEGEARRVM